MVTIKRYIGKIRKPLHWKGRKAFLRFAVLPALLAVALLLVVRMMVVTQYEMPYNRYDLDLLQGDRLAVNRLAYGWTTPLPRLFGEHHVGECLPKKGDLVAFASPAGNDQVLVERVEALPGDTVEVETLLRDGQEWCDALWSARATASLVTTSCPCAASSVASSASLIPWTPKRLSTAASAASASS